MAPTTDFYRIKRLPPYIFEEVNRLKAQARARGDDIIDFGMGNPDMPTPKLHCRQADARRCSDPQEPTAIPLRAASRG